MKNIKKYMMNKNIKKGSSLDLENNWFQELMA
jgi:hypothetical protein